MFDTMTLTKTVGALCGALLVFLLGGWAAQTIYTTGGGHGGGHGGEQAQGYAIDTGAEEQAPVEEDTGPSFPELMAAATPDKGERVFSKCRACHKLEQGANAVGPYLYGVVGREVGSAEGFGYSGALSKAADVWTPENLYAFLENPGDYASGTTMGFAGLSKPEDRANVIAYLDMTDGDRTPVEIPAEEKPATDQAAAEGEDAGAATEETVEDAKAATQAVDADKVVEPETTQAVSEEAASDSAAASDEGGTAEPAAAEEETATGTEATGTGGDQSAFAAKVAAADPAMGKKLFNRCRACHQLQEGRNGAGPYLYQIVGRDIASADGFSYSDALKSLDGVWTADKLNGWLKNPNEYAPGNRMGFPGLKGEDDRAALIAYLKSAAN